MRNDIHSPSNILPENYTYVGTVYLGNDFERTTELNDSEAWDALEENGWKEGNFARNKTCDHCGARFLYGAVYLHVSGDALCVGHTCSSETFNYSSRAALDLKNLKRAVAKAKERAKIAIKVQELLAQTPMLAEAFEKNTGNSFIFDVQAKLNLYGSLSINQINAVLRAFEKDQEFKARIERRKAAEALEVREPAPTSKKIEINGIILSTKLQESYYGSQLKMLVKDERGFKVWGSVPNNIDEIDHVNMKGKRVRFVCSLEQSKDDEYFGFFKRPRNAEIVEAA